MFAYEGDFRTGSGAATVVSVVASAVAQQAEYIEEAKRVAEEERAKRDREDQPANTNDREGDVVSLSDEARQVVQSAGSNPSGSVGSAPQSQPSVDISA